MTKPVAISFQEGVGMSADNEVYAPRRIEKLGKHFVFFKAYVCEQHRKVDVCRIVSITDSADFLSRISIEVHPFQS